MLFSKFNVNKGEWLDLVFADRNKSYGAYELRKYSDQYLVKALLISFGAFALFVIGPAMYYTYKNQDLVTQTTTVTNLYDDDKVYKLEEIDVPRRDLPKAEQILETSPSTQVATVNVNQVKYTQQMNVVRDDLGIDPPTIDDLKNAIIGSDPIIGTETTDKNLMPGVSNSTNASPGGTETTTFDMVSVERMPEFPGGMSAWSKFLSKNLNYPAMARDAGVQGRVTVSFIVEKDGSISNITVLRGIGGGCDEEAVRVIKKSPFWKPGMQNGRPVRVSYVIPIVFALQ